MVLPDSDANLSLHRTQDISFNTDTQVLPVWAQVRSLSATKTIAFAFSSSLFYEWLI